MRLGYGSRAESCRWLSRRTAAVLHLTVLRGDAFTGLDSIPAALPVCCVCRERTSGLDHQLVGRQDPGPPGYLAMRRMPGVRADLVFGISNPDRTVPSASRRSGKPCNQ